MPFQPADRGAQGASWPHRPRPGPTTSTNHRPSGEPRPAKSLRAPGQVTGGCPRWCVPDPSTPPPARRWKVTPHALRHPGWHRPSYGTSGTYLVETESPLDPGKRADDVADALIRPFIHLDHHESV